MRWTTLALVALCVLSTVTVVLGECPNGCSGNGDCMNKDMCNCYKNYQGNDCADRTCMFGRAHVDTPKGDIDMDQDQFSPGWLLADSQQDPAQTYEYFNPDALADEAHFYMECSNKGICERATGLCACFDGFEGNGCQRTTCPGKCNDHGTCESMRELASKNGGTLFGMEGTVGAVAYDLWDANSTYGCRCDPWFFGPDCNKRNCKVGVDPMYKSAGAPRHETFVIHAYKAAALVVGDGAYIRLRLFDYYGESFITERIALTGTVADDAAAVAAAITRVPNQTYRKVECSPMGLVASDFEFFKSVLPGAFGVSITCQLTENPGKLRIPEIAANHIVDAVVVTTSMQGEDTDLFPIKSAFVISAIDGTGLIITLTLTSPDSSGLDGKLIKIGNHIVETTAGTGTTLNLRYPLLHPIGTNPSIYTMDPAGLVTLAASKLVDVDVPVGSSKLIFSTVVAAGELAKGDLIFLENAFYYIQGISDNDDPTTPAADPTEFYAWLDKPFGGKAADGVGLLIADLANPMKVPLPTDTKGYQYVSECAGRGMCGYDTGICTCFKGYTNDNCDTQNILAL